MSVKHSVLFLTKYARNGASSRYRTFQYLPYFRDAGMDCHVSPLFDEAYLRQRYEGGRSHIKSVMAAFVGRLCLLMSARRYDLVVIEYEVLPYFAAVPERFLVWLGVPYVVDYDDALFHQYDQHKRWWIRRLLGKKIAHVMRGASLVTAGNAYLADYALRAGATRVEIVPTVVDLERYQQAALPHSGNAAFTVGWIGSPTTAKYLEAIAPALTEVCAGENVRVCLIGSGPVWLPGVPVEVLPWEIASEVHELQQFDMGIMPLPDEPWARGKCGLKLIQYMACGLPVVASPVGANCEIVEHGVNGYLAATLDEWVQALRKLLLDTDLRQQMGKVGRSKVEEGYSLQVTGPRLAELLQSIARGD